VYGSKHTTALLASIIESVEDNLLHAFLNVENSAEVKVSVEAETEVATVPCWVWCQWVTLMVAKYGAASLFFLVCIIFGAKNKSYSWLIAVGAIVWLFWLWLLFAHMCCTAGSRETDTWLSWTASSFFR
jgi:hypothetical protein